MGTTRLSFNMWLLDATGTAFTVSQCYAISKLDLFQKVMDSFSALLNDEHADQWQKPISIELRHLQWSVTDYIRTVASAPADSLEEVDAMCGEIWDRVLQVCKERGIKPS